MTNWELLQTSVYFLLMDWSDVIVWWERRFGLICLLMPNQTTKPHDVKSRYTQTSLSVNASTYTQKLSQNRACLHLIYIFRTVMLAVMTMTWPVTWEWVAIILSPFLILVTFRDFQHWKLLTNNRRSCLVITLSYQHHLRKAFWRPTLTYFLHTMQGFLQCDLHHR